MKVGTVRERKDGENRVGLTPEGAHALRAGRHEVLGERGAGEGSGHTAMRRISLPAPLLRKRRRTFGRQ